jgi:hypothetical protein
VRDKGDGKCQAGSDRGKGFRKRAERFLSAQADPSHEAKGRKKSACSVGNDDLCGSLIGIEVSSQLCGVSAVGTIWL